MDGWRLRGALLSARRSAPAARCALPRARGRVRRCPGSVLLHVSSLRASAPLSVPLPPSPAALAASPRLRPRRTHGEQWRAALAAGRAEGVGRAGGGGRGRGQAPESLRRAGRPARRRDGEAEMLGRGCGDGGGGRDSARGAELETEVTEGRAVEGGLGNPAGGARSLRAARQMHSRPSPRPYPRERPAGDILTPHSPFPPRGERSFTTTHRYTKTPSGAKDRHTRLNSYADACCPHLLLAFLPSTIRSRPGKSCWRLGVRVSFRYVSSAGVRLRQVCERGLRRNLFHLQTHFPSP